MSLIKVIADIKYLSGNFSFGTKDEKKRTLPDSLRLTPIIAKKSASQLRNEAHQRRIIRDAEIAQRNQSEQARIIREALVRTNYLQREQEAEQARVNAQQSRNMAIYERNRISNAVATQARIDEERRNICSICLERVGELNRTVTPCNHVFHTTCLCRFFNTCSGANRSCKICPNCRTPFNDLEVTQMCPGIIPLPIAASVGIIPSNFRPGSSFSDLFNQVNPNTGLPYTYQELRQ